MDDILDRIYKARIEMFRRGQEPTAVYLGYEESCALRVAAHDNGAVTPCTLTADNTTRVFNMAVYEVNEARHLRVV